MNEFTVVDIKTGRYPDLEKLALEEAWARNLVYCDMDGFYLAEDGELYLTDKCGNIVPCPEGRFKVVFRKVEKKLYRRIKL